LVSLTRTAWSDWSEPPGQLQPNSLVNIAEIRNRELLEENHAEED
jgi:hypothetical protein